MTLTLSPALDLATRVEQVVAEDKLRCEPPTRDPGGGGINVARAAVRLGEPTTAVFPVGGPTGQLLAARVADEGVDADTVDVAAHTRENVSVTETTTDRQFRFVMPGAELTPEDVDACVSAVVSHDAEIVVASGSVPAGVDARVYAGLVESLGGRRVVVDTSGPALRAAVDAGAWLLKPNLRELADLVGRELDGDQAVLAAARELLGGGTEAVVVSMGAGGAVLVAGDTCAHLRSPTVPIRSRVGAGDSTVAGIVVGVLMGEPLPEAVRRGVAAGAAAVMTEGSELCRREDVDRLLQQVG